MMVRTLLWVDGRWARDAVGNSWSGGIPAHTFNVRGRSYLTDKKKVPSMESMYEVVQV
jgi:hypothetical protein